MLEPIPRRWECRFVVPRFIAALIGYGDYPLGNQAWGDDRIPLTNGSPQYWRDVIQILETEGFLYARDVLQHFPVDLLLSGDGR